MDRSLTYNGSLTAEQFLFYEIRIASGFFLDGKTVGEAIETIQQGNLMSIPLKSIMPVFPNKAAVNSFPKECAIRDRFIPFLGGKSGMIGVFRLESQMLPGNGKFERTGIGPETKSKEATNTAFNYLKANASRISGTISTTAKDCIINYQDLQGIGMTEKLALPTLIALCSIALGKPTLGSLAVLGEIGIGGTMIKVDALANALQVCLDSGAKKVLLPIASAADLGLVPPELIGGFNLIFYVDADLVERYFYRHGRTGQRCTRCSCSPEAKLGQYGLYIQCCGSQKHRYKLDEI